MIRTVAKTGVIALALISTNVTSFVSAAGSNYEIPGENTVITFDINELRVESPLFIKEPTEGHIKYVETEIVKLREEEEKAKIENERKDARAEKIRAYLASRGAPLANYARVIVDAGEKHGVEPELIAAISIIESGGGKINFKPHNAWGWGRSSWANWETAIDEYAAGLARGYISKGLTTPAKMSRIYCPPNSSYWARNVQDQMNKMLN